MIDMGHHKKGERPAEGHMLMPGDILEAHAHVVFGVARNDIQADAYLNIPPFPVGYHITL